MLIRWDKHCDMVNLQVIFLVSETEMIFLMVFTTFEHISSSQFSKVQLKSTVQWAMSSMSLILWCSFFMFHTRETQEFHNCFKLNENY